MPDLLAHLRALQGAGTRHALAVRLGVPHPVLYQVLSGRMAPPPRLLAAVGWERVVTYQPAEVVESEVGSVTKIALMTSATRRPPNHDD
jgi:DNA-binding transcriptional regulator YdaS (Cro superfamily)